MSQPPTGSAFAMGLAPERRFGVPAPGLVAYGAALPVTAELVAASSPSAQVHASGIPRLPVPGDITGPVQWGHPLTAAHFLEFFEHVLLRSSREELAPGVFEYTFWPSLVDCASTSFWGVFAKGSLEVWLRYGIRFSQLSWESGGSGEILLRADGLGTHGSSLGPAVPAPANTGTYPLGPWARGTLAEPAAGPVWLRVESLGPLTFKILQAPAEPNPATWQAAPTAYPVETAGPLEAPEGEWQLAMASSDGRDLGLVTPKNWDPLQIIWPGTEGEHAALAVGDVFHLPVLWQAPPLAPLAHLGSFTGAHWHTQVGEVGGPLQAKSFDSATYTLGWPLAPRGRDGRYVSHLHRDGEAQGTVELKRPLEDAFFASHALRGTPIRYLSRWQGRLLAPGLRESLTLELPHCHVARSERPVATAGIVEETIQLRHATNEAGDPPLTLKAVTTREWEPTPQP